MTDKDTICAISTAPGVGAVAIIRLSGDKAIEIAGLVFQPAGKRHVSQLQPYSYVYGSILENDKLIDQVMLAVFYGPKSYTGEDTVEISCHGSVYIQQKIVQLLIKKGARHAQAGEFTMRAFMNGKMDLSQAEAVADLVASSTKASHQVAMQQMRGGFSDEISKLRDRLLHFISMIELELDFSEEDVEFADRKDLENLLLEIDELITRLVKSFELGNALKNGIPVAIVGNTNVGKSTLLNKILNEEKAIVSEIAGTTRDVIEDVINIEGIAFRFIDTAGIRETTDTIETMGIERTYDRIDKASVILLLAEATDSPEQIEKAIKAVRQREGQEDKKLIVLINKIDQVQEVPSIKNLLKENEEAVAISAKTGRNMDKLIAALLSVINIDVLNQDQVIVSNVRHYEALIKAQEGLVRALESVRSGITGDFLAMDIRDVLNHLGEITGHITTDEVLGNIFKNFCIGK